MTLRAADQPGLQLAADPGASPQPSRRSLHGLDWFAFFLADVQTGWGPFVAAYLTSVGWLQFHIGLILTIGTLSSLLLQIPAGALVDHAPAKRLVAALAVAAISASALLIALWPTFSVVVVAKLLHAAASCLAGPALAAISLGLVGHVMLSARLGRNARFLSLGNAIAAGIMGWLAYLVSNQAIFFLTAALAIPTLIALGQVRHTEINPYLARGGAPNAERGEWGDAFRSVVRNRALLVFGLAIVLFQLANAAMLPVVAGFLTLREPETATLILSICILAPQFVVAAIAPMVGRWAQSWGRRPLLVLCFAALAARGALFSVVSHPYGIVAVQLLDGVSAATLGVLVPLIVADVMRGTGHFNFAQGVIGVAVGIGASISTALAGYLADALGGAVFLFMAAGAVAGIVLVLAWMPETRDAPPGS